jgi:hypothetical protein
VRPGVKVHVASDVASGPTSSSGKTIPAAGGQS